MSFRSRNDTRTVYTYLPTVPLSPGVLLVGVLHRDLTVAQVLVVHALDRFVARLEPIKKKSQNCRALVRGCSGNGINGRQQQHTIHVSSAQVSQQQRQQQQQKRRNLTKKTNRLLPRKMFPKHAKNKQYSATRALTLHEERAHPNTLKQHFPSKPCMPTRASTA